MISGILNELSAAKVKLSLIDGQIRLEGPAGLLTDDLVERIRSNKLALIEALQPQPEPPDSGTDRPDPIAAFIARWPEDRRERFEERAAIIEFDGGLSRAEAEALAFDCHASELDRAACMVVTRFQGRMIEACRELDN